MATYKKRGHKPKTKVEKQDAIEQNSTTAEVFGSLDEGASKAEQWVAKNQKSIFLAVGAIVLIVLASLGYQKLIQEPKEVEAKNDMFKAQTYFDQAMTAVDQDSLLNLTLNGGEGNYGMLDVIGNHSGTVAANLANYYAGMSYYKLKDYSNAITYLDAFEGEDNMLAPMAKGTIGDAFVQLEQFEDALDYYEQASKASDNEFSAPMFLMKGAKVALIKLNQPAKALSLLQTIEDKYPNSTEAANAAVLKGQAEAAAN
ncbi:MAG: tetratricopeptide repeat protein [bacterium]